MIRNKNVIATFHNVTNQEWFDDTIQFFSSNYQIVNAEKLHQLMAHGKSFSNILHLTVDDGHQTFYHTIFPVLKKYHVPATLFVSPEIIIEQKNFWFQMDRGLDQNKMIQIISEELNVPALNLRGIPYHHILKCLTIQRIHRIIDQYYYKTNTLSVPPQNMSIDQLIEVHRSGLVTIGAHSLSHPILSNESDEVVENEIGSSISRLQSILESPVFYFAYPNGHPNLDFGQREIDICIKNKIKLAFSGEFREFELNSNKYSMPRMGFSHGGTNKIKLKLILGQLWPFLIALRNRPEGTIRKSIAHLLSEY